MLTGQEVGENYRAETPGAFRGGTFRYKRGRIPETNFTYFAIWVRTAQLHLPLASEIHTLGQVALLMLSSQRTVQCGGVKNSLHSLGIGFKNCKICFETLCSETHESFLLAKQILLGKNLLVIVLCGIETDFKCLAGSWILSCQKVRMEKDECQLCCWKNKLEVPWGALGSTCPPVSCRHIFFLLLV